MLHDPDNALYDAAADLVDRALTIAALAGDEDATAAVPATLGCIEEALWTLAQATSALREPEGPGLADALHTAARACGEARAAYASA